jgi:hypothetical protein
MCADFTSKGMESATSIKPHFCPNLNAYDGKGMRDLPLNDIADSLLVLFGTGSELLSSSTITVGSAGEV